MWRVRCLVAEALAQQVPGLPTPAACPVHGSLGVPPSCAGVETHTPAHSLVPASSLPAAVGPHLEEMQGGLQAMEQQLGSDSPLVMAALRWATISLLAVFLWCGRCGSVLSSSRGAVTWAAEQS